jgi:hypothetical protein
MKGSAVESGGSGHMDSETVSHNSDLPCLLTPEQEAVLNEIIPRPVEVVPQILMPASSSTLRAESFSPIASSAFNFESIDAPDPASPTTQSSCVPRYRNPGYTGGADTAFGLYIQNLNRRRRLPPLFRDSKGSTSMPGHDFAFKPLVSTKSQESEQSR